MVVKIIYFCDWTYKIGFTDRVTSPNSSCKYNMSHLDKDCIIWFCL